MTRDQRGRFIGGGFGLVFIEVNAGALPAIVSLPLRVLAIAAFLGLVVALRRGQGPLATDTASSTQFGRRYRLVVAVEVVVGQAGIFVVNGLLHAPHLTVAWVALVVGVHFFGLAAVWRRPSLHLLGAAMSACGAVGLLLGAYGGSPVAVAAVAGIVPGALLLGFAWWNVHSTADRRAAALS